jgi:hypothetical protein
MPIIIPMTILVNKRVEKLVNTDKYKQAKTKFV